MKGHRIKKGLKPEELKRMRNAYIDMPHRERLREQRALRRNKTVEGELSHQTDIGPRSRATTEVKIRAMELSRNKKALAAAQSIAKFVHNTEVVGMGRLEGTKALFQFYNTQTAHDIVVKRRTPSIESPTGPIAGCQTLASTMAGLLRVAKPKSGKITHVKVVRTRMKWGLSDAGEILGMPHTIVSFKINGEQHYADPFNRGGFLGGKLVSSHENLKKEIQGTIEKLKKQGNWREAHDVTALGIHTFQDFLNESKESKADLATRLDIHTL